MIEEQPPQRREEKMFTWKRPWRKAKAADKAEPPRPPPAGHRVGETTAEFRIRTADGIRIELEQEVDPEQLREMVRKYWEGQSSQ